MSETENTQLAPVGGGPISRMAAKYGTTADALRKTCDEVCFKPDRDGNVPPDTLKLAFYLVCESHDLNPLRREVFALYDAKKNILMPYVSIDGWLRKCNENPAFDGMEVTIDGWKESDIGQGRTLRHPTGATCTIWRKDRAHPIKWSESWEENFQPNKYLSGNWYERPERMMKWKAIIQCARVAFHLAGVYDEQEAMEAIHGKEPPISVRDRQADKLRRTIEDAKEAKAKREAQQPEPAEVWSKVDSVDTAEGTATVGGKSYLYAAELHPIMGMAEQGIAMEVVIENDRITKARDA